MQQVKNKEKLMERVAAGNTTNHKLLSHVLRLVNISQYSFSEANTASGDVAEQG